MAIMYPNKPREFMKNSKEDIMFEALSKLPDSYYIFHSFSIVNVSDGIIHESETDFVIFNPQKGIMCLEAKAGNVKYENGQWLYGSGIPMSHDGPFNQASTNKWKLINYINKKGYNEIIKKCKIIHAVWFPSISKEKFENVSLPSEADNKLMLTCDSFFELESEISKIFEISVSNGVETHLNGIEVNSILNNILAPSFNLISISEMKLNHNRIVFKKMLDEQISLLNYLEDQHSAVINGMAGTGKTVIALEKAKRHSDKKEKVLFLCYNKFLKEYLKANYPYKDVDYFTIDGLACDFCNTTKANYQELRNILDEMYMNNTFPYKHVVIDEGQDFGKDSIDEENIIEYLKMNVVDSEDNDGTFYIFYDKNQMIQSKKIPDYISNADCKLTLYKNCRNTINIARTSLRFLRNEKSPKMNDDSIIGEVPKMFFCANKEESVNIINKIIEETKEDKIETLQILTCKTEDVSILKDECSCGKYLYKNYKIPFTTCKKFKGLESEAVILVDVDKKMIESEFEQLLYVGSSRAKFKLYIISNLMKSECIKILDQLKIKKGKDIFKSLSTIYNTKYISE